MIIKQDIRPNKMIWVTFRKEGIHKYPAAATDPNLCTAGEMDVSFLGNAHRHIFHFKVWISVVHNDRDYMPTEDCGYAKNVLEKFKELALADEKFDLVALIQKELEKVDEEN